jgi:hypothetical protein
MADYLAQGFGKMKAPFCHLYSAPARRDAYAMTPNDQS